MAGKIIPIKLTLSDNEHFTLWAPRWREGEEDWEGFLGDEDNLFVFDDVPSLATYVYSNEENDLSDHPYWNTLLKNKLIDFVPKSENEYDLIEILELFATEPNPDSVEKAEKVFDITRTLGEVADLPKTTKFFNGNIILGAISSQNDDIYSKQGNKVWQKIAKIINKNWGNVIEEIDAFSKTPKISQKDLENNSKKLEQELEKSSAETVATEDKVENIEESTASVTDVPLITEMQNYSDSAPIDSNSPWYKAGIDPISITIGDGTYYSLRCYLDDSPVFLGNGKQIYIFDSTAKLIDFIKSDSKSALADLDTYKVLQELPTDFKVEILPENNYQLNGIETDIEAGLLRIDKNQLALATELIEDVAAFCSDTDLLTSISTSTPLGWLINSILNPENQKLKPQPPFDTEAEAWQVVVYDFTKLLAQNP